MVVSQARSHLKQNYSSNASEGGPDKAKSQHLRKVQQNNDQLQQEVFFPSEQNELTGSDVGAYLNNLGEFQKLPAKSSNYQYLMH